MVPDPVVPQAKRTRNKDNKVIRAINFMVVFIVVLRNTTTSFLQNYSLTHRFKNAEACYFDFLPAFPIAFHSFAFPEGNLNAKKI